MRKLLFCLMALGMLALVGCEKEDNYSTDFSGMWAFVAEYDSEDGTYVYDKVDEVLSFEDGRVKIYETRRDSGYDFKNGYLDCSKSDLYAPSTFSVELHKDKCYLYEVYKGELENIGYLQIKGDKLYWRYDDDDDFYDIYERIKGFTED